MPVEIVTIVNSSGKIISNGKQLVNAFKEAKAAYDEKKAALKVERAIQRAQTFDTSRAPRYEPEPQYEHGAGRYAIDDGASQASSRRSHRSKHGRKRSVSQSRPALTVGNLRTHSEVSSVAPSRPPDSYRPPYAETAPRDMVLSRPNLGRAPTMPVPPTGGMVHVPADNQQVQRSRSDPSLKKEADTDDLAYGSIPPDLEERVDLDPAHRAAEKEEEAETARTLIEKIEDLLMEAQCLHHTANHIIEHLQGRPEAAAAVALALAELSALIGKMSPSFLAVLKGGSPAIFALLASPQFLIAAGLAVGVTVVMFGGWKIVRQVKEAKEAQAAARTPAMAFEAHPTPAAQPEQPLNAPYPPSEASQGFDEALVMEEELSTIETWRRGITPFGEDETADMELISPEADRAIRGQYGGDDARTERSSRTSRTHKSSKSHKKHERHESTGSRAYDGDVDGVSEAGSRRSHRSHKSPQTHRSQKTEKTESSSKTKRSSRTTVRALEDGHRDKENTIEAVLRPKKDKKKDSGNNMFKNIIEKMKKKEEEKERGSMLRVA